MGGFSIFIDVFTLQISFFKTPLLGTNFRNEIHRMPLPKVIKRSKDERIGVGADKERQRKSTHLDIKTGLFDKLIL